MDRAGFLKLSLGLIVAAVGLSRLLMLVGQTKQQSQHDDSVDGYGGSPYGR